MRKQRIACKQAFNFDQRTEREGRSNQRFTTSIGVQSARPLILLSYAALEFIPRYFLHVRTWIL